jgi:exoribonuclease-2
VQAYTLLEGRDCPAVSLYVQYDEETLVAKGHETRLERVPIAANLRHDQLDGFIDEAWLQDATVQRPGLPEAAARLRPELALLHRLARQLKAQRELVRGKPENFNRPDYNFRLATGDGDEPHGDEAVEIVVRRRGAPLDLIVSEAMIVANSTWGLWLAELGVPGIYRSQASMAPGVKVRMGTKAQPHAGLGVKAYAWSTSPLRRYTDLVNQWQVIAAARHGRTAALAAPFKPKDAELFSIISAFDAAYGAYNANQAGMERYWTLQYIRQQGLHELEATVFKEGLARADTLPLVLPVLGAGDLPRGSRVRVRLGEIDLITLDVSGTVIERLDAAPAAAASEEDDSDEETVAGPIAIAVDVTDTPEDEAGAPVAAASPT